MHDRNGTLLQKGDTVLIPCVIDSLSEGEDFCNVTLKSVFGRRPDDAKEVVSAINTGVLVKVKGVHPNGKVVAYCSDVDVAPASLKPAPPAEPKKCPSHDGTDGS